MSQNSLKTHLVQVEQAGIYRLQATEFAALAQSAAAIGFACFKVNLEAATSIDAILAALGRELDFPAWYGANLDALNDCLTDFSWNEAKGYVLILTGVEASPIASDDLAMLNEVLASAIAQWQEQDVPFWVFYEFRHTGQAEELASLPILQ
jgi:hypothetical protein